MERNPIIYLDNAATSWPKPQEVLEAVRDFYDSVGANPGRGGHSPAVEAGRRLFEARSAVAELFDASNPLSVVFTANITESINIVLRGLLRPGDHVVTTGMEHNAVARPLAELAKTGVRITYLEGGVDGIPSITALRDAVEAETALLVMNHASNVCGSILPVREAGRIARERGIYFLLDTAQTAGVLPVSMRDLEVDFLAFTGHKGLLGPTGTGGLVFGERVDPSRLNRLQAGGTGSRSDSLDHPEFLPDRFEAGTRNTAGLCGLTAGLRWIRERGIEQVRRHKIENYLRLRRGLTGIPGLRIQGQQDPERQIGVISFTLGGMDPATIGETLDEAYGIAVRVGLHCAPLAHRTLGTFPEGTVRMSSGPLTRDEEIDRCIAAVRAIASSGGEGR
jgi:cysteine desulfurase family protein